MERFDSEGDTDGADEVGHASGAGRVPGVDHNPFGVVTAFEVEVDEESYFGAVPWVGEKEFVIEVAEVVVEADEVERGVVTKSGDGFGGGVDMELGDPMKDPSELSVSVVVVV